MDGLNKIDFGLEKTRVVSKSQSPDLVRTAKNEYE
jgi:hypothetical protein